MGVVKVKPRLSLRHQPDRGCVIYMNVPYGLSDDRRQEKAMDFFLLKGSINFGLVLNTKNNGVFFSIYFIHENC